MTAWPPYCAEDDLQSKADFRLCASNCVHSTADQVHQLRAGVGFLGAVGVAECPAVRERRHERAHDGRSCSTVHCAGKVLRQSRKSVYG